MESRFNLGLLRLGLEIYCLADLGALWAQHRFAMVSYAPV